MINKLYNTLFILIAAFAIFRPITALAIPGQTLKFVLEPESSIRIFPELIAPGIYADPTYSPSGKIENLSGYFVIKHAGSFEYEAWTNQVLWKIKGNAYDLINLEFTSPSTRITFSASNFDDDTPEVITQLICRKYDGSCLNNDNILSSYGDYPYKTAFDGDYLINHNNVASIARIWSDGIFTGSSTKPDSISMQLVHITTGYPDFDYHADMKLRAVREPVLVPEISSAGSPLSIGLLLVLIMFFRERYRLDSGNS